MRDLCAIAGRRGVGDSARPVMGYRRPAAVFLCFLLFLGRSPYGGVSVARRPLSPTLLERWRARARRPGRCAIVTGSAPPPRMHCAGMVGPGWAGLYGADLLLCWPPAGGVLPAPPPCERTGLQTPGVSHPQTGENPKGNKEKTLLGMMPCDLVRGLRFFLGLGSLLVLGLGLRGASCFAPKKKSELRSEFGLGRCQRHGNGLPPFPHVSAAGKPGQKSAGGGRT